jgi:hypothetical protein
MILIGFILGWIFGNVIGGKSEGKKGLIHWTWFLDTFKIHLHHWIIMSIILIMYIIMVASKSAILEDPNETSSLLAMVASKSAILEDPNETSSLLATINQSNYNSYIVGFLLGGIIQGLSYSDRFKIFL